MKHKLPIAIIVVAAAAAITGVISFQSGVFQTASIAEITKIINKPAVVEPVGVNDPVSNSSATLDSTSIVCSDSTSPRIKIISPNGGETYTPGHKLTVKWETCNMTSTDNVHVSLVWKDSQGGTGGSSNSATVNDGQAVITLPSDVGNGGYYKSGKLYKVQVIQSVNGAPNYTGSVDTSDNLFTIISRK